MKIFRLRNSYTDTFVILAKILLGYYVKGITRGRSSLEETRISTVLIIFVCLLHFSCVLTNPETSLLVLLLFENTYPGRLTKPDNDL